MEYKAIFSLKTSEFNPINDDFISLDALSSGYGIRPLNVTEEKSFRRDSDEDAVLAAQCIAYNMAKIINPYSRAQPFSQVVIERIENMESGITLDLPDPGSHFADSATRKYLRGEGENHVAEMVGVNSDVLFPYDFLTASRKRTKEPSYTDEFFSMFDAFSERYMALFENPGDLDFKPGNSLIYVWKG